jgi:hypothetical protein
MPTMLPAIFSITRAACRGYARPKCAENRKRGEMFKVVDVSNVGLAWIGEIVA